MSAEFTWDSERDTSPSARQAGKLAIHSGAFQFRSDTPTETAMGHIVVDTEDAVSVISHEEFMQQGFRPSTTEPEATAI
jgi:hypothetical protein